MKRNVPIVKSESVETWNEEKFSPTTFDIIQPSATLDDGGKINYYHKLSMETGKVSIAAALMTALILMKKKTEYNGAFEEWLQTNTVLSCRTAYRYMSVLSESFGKARAVDLAHDSANMQLKAVEAFTAQTNYRSLYQIYHSAGIVKKSNMGGANRGQGRKPKADIEELKAQAEYLAHDPENAERELDEMLTALESWAIAADKFALLSTEKIAAAVKRLKEVAARATELALAKSKRGE